MEHNECVLRVNNLTKAFYDGHSVTIVFSDVSFEVKRGELVAVMGRSGSGKSVLMNVLGGILPISKGSIEILGTTVTDILDKSTKKNIGLTFQTDNLMPWRTVRRNLKLPLETYRKKFDYSADARAMMMLELVGLENYPNIFPHELSGGMRQRVGFARALMHDPEILLLDQPFGALDAITRSMMGYQLLNLIKTSNKSGVIVTNDFREAILLASKVVFLSDKGRIVNSVDIDIPYEERDENISSRQGYGELEDYLKATFDSLSGDGEGEVE